MCLSRIRGFAVWVRHRTRFKGPINQQNSPRLRLDHVRAVCRYLPMRRRRIVIRRDAVAAAVGVLAARVSTNSCRRRRSSSSSRETRHASQRPPSRFRCPRRATKKRKRRCENGQKITWRLQLRRRPPEVTQNRYYVLLNISLIMGRSSLTEALRKKASRSVSSDEIKTPWSASHNGLNVYFTDRLREHISPTALSDVVHPLSGTRWTLKH